MSRFSCSRGFDRRVPGGLVLVAETEDSIFPFSTRSTQVGRRAVAGVLGLLGEEARPRAMRSEVDSCFGWSLVSWLTEYRSGFLSSVKAVNVCSLASDQCLQSSKASRLGSRQVSLDWGEPVVM